MNIAMAPNLMTQPLIALRMVTQRLLSTPTSQLPYVSPFLANAITYSREAFVLFNDDANSRTASETNVYVHKLKTQLSTLLQDKSPEGRFAALILIKAMIEVGDWKVLQGTGSWVKILISLIGVSYLNLWLNAIL